MLGHKGKDYKISAVQYFLENNVSYSKTCEIFKCSERSLKRWVNMYKEEGSNINNLPTPVDISSSYYYYVNQFTVENKGTLSFDEIKSKWAMFS